MKLYPSTYIQLSIWALFQTPRSIAFSPNSLGNKFHQSRVILDAAKVGIFFGTSTGNTENAADLIVETFGEDCEGPFEIDSIGDLGGVAKKFAEYDALVVGTPTWNTGADSERSGTGWDDIYYGEMQDLNISGKKVAVFGLGDQVSYAENYADASGELHDVFENLGCKMLGYTSQDGYEHETSKAIRGDKFCGLLLDAVNQEDMTEERVENWISQLIDEGILEGGGAAQDSSSPAMVVETASASVSASLNENDLLAQLERENAELRKMLEENSKLLDENLANASVGSTTIMEEGFAPHYNPSSGRTMWTSRDGKKCYYTTGAPKLP